jgi:hypothetical protein
MAVAAALPGEDERVAVAEGSSEVTLHAGDRKRLLSAPTGSSTTAIAPRAAATFRAGSSASNG